MLNNYCSVRGAAVAVTLVALQTCPTGVVAQLQPAVQPGPPATTFPPVIGPVGDFVFRQTNFPLCNVFDEPIEFTGRAKFVNTDGSAGPPTTGDLSIVASLDPTASLPILTTYFRVSKLSAQGICVITEDTTGMPDTAPTCGFEVGLQYCIDSTGGSIDCSIRNRSGKFFVQGTGPEPSAITGGTEDFNGAFGSFVTGGTFVQTNVDQNGDFDLTFSATIKICYWANID